MSDTGTEDVSQEETSSEENSAPWEQDLATRFEDEDIRTQVSEFLGETVQPYVTKIEQEARPNRDATRLWEGFNTNPVETYVQVSRELYGDEVADKVAAILQGGSPEEQTPPTDTQETTPPETTEEQPQGVKFDDLPVEVREAVAAQQQEKLRTEYYNEVERITAENAEKLPKDAEGKAQLNVDLFHPFVVANDGDFDAAISAFLQFQENAKKEFGIQVPEGETPPTTIDSQTRDAAATPPQEKDYEGNLDAAIDDFFAEQKSPPPTVGAA